MPRCCCATSTGWTTAAQRMNMSPLGCGALAGTTYPIDRDVQRPRLLGFDGVTPEQPGRRVRPRFLHRACRARSRLLMMHLSRFSRGDHPLVLAGNSSSSSWTTPSPPARRIMPQKKNPDVAELVRGKTGRVYGDLMTPADRDEGPAAGLQQGHAGGQGGRVRRGGHREDVPDRVSPPCSTP